MPTRQKGVGLDSRTRDGFLRMTRSLTKGVPEALRYKVYDFRRAEPRNVKPLGLFPELADACLKAGAPITDVLAPLHAEEDRILELLVVAGKLPGPFEARSCELRATQQEDYADLEWGDRQDGASLDAVVDALHEQELATRIKRAVLLGLRRGMR